MCQQQWCSSTLAQLQSAAAQQCQQFLSAPLRRWTGTCSDDPTPRQSAPSSPGSGHESQHESECQIVPEVRVIPLPSLPCHKGSCDQLGGASMGHSWLPSNPTLDHRFPRKNIMFWGGHHCQTHHDTPTLLGNVWKYMDMWQPLKICRA